MLGKLLKHELRATSATMLPIFGVMLLVSAMVNVGARLMDGRDLPNVVGVVFALIIVLFVVGLMSIGIVTVFMMVRRFRDNLLRDEGYIMHTLPVSVHAQVWSKVIVSAMWYALAGITMVLSIFIVSLDVNTVKAVGDFIDAALEGIIKEKHVAEILAEIMGILILLSLVMSLSFDAALSIGHSFAKRKMALSVLIFIGLLILSNIFTVAVADLGLVRMEPDYGGAYSQVGRSFVWEWRRICAYWAGILAVEGAVCYAITVFFLKRKLNLE